MSILITSSQNVHMVVAHTHGDRQMESDGPRQQVCLFVFSRVFKLTLITAMYLKHDTSNVYELGRSGGSWDGI